MKWETTDANQQKISFQFWRQNVCTCKLNNYFGAKTSKLQVFLLKILKGYLWLQAFAIFILIAALSKLKFVQIFLTFEQSFNFGTVEHIFFSALLYFGIVVLPPQIWSILMQTWSCPHRSFSDYYLLPGDFVVEPKIILLIINYLVILWSQSKIIDYMEKTIH